MNASASRAAPCGTWASTRFSVTSTSSWRTQSPPQPPGLPPGRPHAGSGAAGGARDHRAAAPGDDRRGRGGAVRRVGTQEAGRRRITAPVQPAASHAVICQTLTFNFFFVPLYFSFVVSDTQFTFTFHGDAHGRLQVLPLTNRFDARRTSHLVDKN